MGIEDMAIVDLDDIERIKEEDKMVERFDGKRLQLLSSESVEYCVTDHFYGGWPERCTAIRRNACNGVDVAVVKAVVDVSHGVWTQKASVNYYKYEDKSQDEKNE